MSDWRYWKWLEDCLPAFFFTVWCCLSEKDAHLCVLRVDDERGGNMFNLPRRHPRRSRKQDAPAVWPADSRRLRSAFVKSSLSPCSYTHRAPPECASTAGLRRGGSKNPKSLFKCLISHRLLLIALGGQGRHYVSSDRNATVVIDRVMMMSKNVKRWDVTMSNEKPLHAHVTSAFQTKSQRQRLVYIVTFQSTLCQWAWYWPSSTNFITYYLSKSSFINHYIFDDNHRN